MEGADAFVFAAGRLGWKVSGSSKAGPAKASGAGAMFIPPLAGSSR